MSLTRSTGAAVIREPLTGPQIYCGHHCCNRYRAWHVNASEMGSVKHLHQHQYKVPTGQEPLGKKPIGVRLYESDDAAVRAMGKDGTQFVREAVHQALIDQQGSSEEPKIWTV